MAKKKMGRWEYTEQELENMFDEATIRGKLASAVEPEAKSVHYDQPSNRLFVYLKNGATFIVPCELVQGLADAFPAEISQVELGPRGASLHWEELDLDYSVVGLLSGVFGNRAWLAKLRRRGKTSRSKTEASRAGTGGVTRLPSQEEIARRAYQIFLERGSLEDDLLDDWLRAERDLAEADN